MPIDKSRYPVNWSAISLERRQAARWRCECCGVPNGARGWRDARGCFRPLKAHEMPPVGRRLTRIILTVAHVGAPRDDGTPGDPHDKFDVRPINLKSLCQACHLWLDLPEHIASARATRARKRLEAQTRAGQQTFEAVTG